MQMCEFYVKERFQNSVDNTVNVSKILFYLYFLCLLIRFLVFYDIIGN